MSLFEHDDNAIGQTEAISNIYATVISSNSIPPVRVGPTNVLLLILYVRKCFILSDQKLGAASRELNRMWDC